MAKPIINKKEIKVAMLGMVEGNGHPYSWSAMFNGYDPEYMKDCPYPVIPQYLAKEPESSFGIDNAKVTHIWTDDPKDAEHVAKASCIPNVVEKAEDVIGKVDAVIIATDIGHEHVKRVKPFIEAGVPAFIDKPLCDNIKDLKTFVKWNKQGHVFLSSSSLRYSKEITPYRLSTNELGELRFVTMTMPKKWETYGIHALEALYPVVGPGFLTVQNTGTYERNIIHMTHKRGIDIVIALIKDMTGGTLQICGTANKVCVNSLDSYFSFKAQLVDFIRYLRTGEKSYPFEETVELMKIIIAGIESRENGNVKIDLKKYKC